jgi:hypothetical protein
MDQSQVGLEADLQEFNDVLLDLLRKYHEIACYEDKRSL